MARERRRILLVEDDPLVAGYIVDVLDDLGFTVVGSASCGNEALALAEWQSPDAAVVDIHLTGDVDGVEVARLLVEKYGSAIVFLSGSCDEKAVVRAQAIRPSCFLQKPFRPSRLLEALEKTLAARSLRAFHLA